MAIFEPSAFSAGFEGVSSSSSNVITFDGINKLVIIPSTAVSISVKIDIYSNWKEWMLLDDHTKYLPAIRSIGGDPIGGGLFAGDIYFMMNGWRVQIGGSCIIDGVLYSDDYNTPFVQTQGLALVINRVSSIVQTVATGNSSGSVITAGDVWSYNNRSLTNYGAYNGPSTADTASAVWNTPKSTLTDSSTVGGYISKLLLSIPKFIGLK
jgi:hypothetical protein